MKKKTYYRLVTAIFAIIAILHAARAVYGWEATVGDVTIPIWVSYAAVLIAGYLAVRGWQFAEKER